MPHICHKNPKILQSLVKRYHQNIQKWQLFQKNQETELEMLLFLPYPPILPPLIILIILPLFYFVNLLPPIVCAFSVQINNFFIKHFIGTIFYLHPPIQVDRWIHIHVVLF